MTQLPLHNLFQGSTGLRKRQGDDDSTTFGYHDGNPDRPLNGEKGFEYNLGEDLLGCFTTVTAVSNCGIAGYGSVGAPHDYYMVHSLPVLKGYLID